MANTDANANSGSAAVSLIGGLLGQVLNQPGVREGLIQELVKLLTNALSGLFNRKPAAPPAPVVKPTPAPNQPAPNFPDDHIPRPTTEVAPRKVTRVKVKLERVQVSKERFPTQYTADNPFGLVDPGPIQTGSNMNWGSKFWIDITAYDQDGHEFLRPDVLTYGLAFNTVIQVGDAFIKGHGPESAGSDKPKAGYETNDTAGIGQGITAWLSSLGFLHQFQAFAGADGKKFQVTASVDGVEAENPFTLGIS